MKLNKTKCLKLAIKVLIILIASVALAAITEGLFRVWDSNWEHERISQVGWVGYCQDMKTVNPKHYLKCEEVLSQSVKNNSTVQYELED